MSTTFFAMAPLLSFLAILAFSFSIFAPLFEFWIMVCLGMLGPTFLDDVDFLGPAFLSFVLFPVFLLLLFLLSPLLFMDISLVRSF
jgi:hypothetical protein